MNSLKKMLIVLTVLAAGIVVQTIANQPELHPALSAALAVGPVF